MCFLAWIQQIFSLLFQFFCLLSCGRQMKVSIFGYLSWYTSSTFTTSTKYLICLKITKKGKFFTYFTQMLLARNIISKATPMRLNPFLHNWQMCSISMLMSSEKFNLTTWDFSRTLLTRWFNLPLFIIKLQIQKCNILSVTGL